MTISRKLSCAVALLSSLLAVNALANPNLLTAGDFEGLSESDLAGYWAPATGIWGGESIALSNGANGVAPSGSQVLM